MAKKPEPLQLTTWNIFKIASTVPSQMTSWGRTSRAAVEKAAQEFKTEAWRLYAVPRQ